MKRAFTHHRASLGGGDLVDTIKQAGKLPLVTAANGAPRLYTKKMKMTSKS
jgi:hypothetical protein